MLPVAALLLALAGWSQHASTAPAAPAPPAAPSASTAGESATDANIVRITTSLLEKSQFSHHPLDAQLASKLLDRYVDALDGTRSLLLQSDVDEMARSWATLVMATRTSGDTRAAHLIFRRYLDRLRQQVAFDDELLRAGAFDFTGHDRFTFDREHAARPADLAAARDLWRQELRAEYLQEKLSDRKPADIGATLGRRHAQQLRTMAALREDEVLEIYLDALAHVYDPHSDYLGKDAMASLSTALNLSLVGIGATLENVDGYCTIRELVPGGPAATSGELAPGDRIVAVAQGRAEPVDVTNMPLGRIVGLIRGTKGSAVTLSILPPAGKPGGPRTVRLVRAEIKLEDQEAKAEILDLPSARGGTQRLAVIDLPSFYSSEENATGGGGAAEDVARLLAKLDAEHVRGVVLDLRHNGGGSLREAVELAGLFIRRGPIVQTRDSQNAIEVETDPDPRVAYDGPLVVLTSRFSASASEIVAGALQDYGRAVIVGDTTTFGKGTVQTIVPLAGLMDRAGLRYAFDPGALKITISKFYRPSGASTELRGVASDIVLPSVSDVAGVGESKLTDPLPWDSVPPAAYQSLNRVARQLPALRAASTRRVAADPGFADLHQEVTEVEQRVKSGQLSLNEAERRRELAEDKALEKRVAAAARAADAALVTYPITLRDAARPGLPAARALPPPKKDEKKDEARAGGGGGPDAGVELGRDEARSPADDLILHESLRILADYVRLSGGTREHI